MSQKKRDGIHSLEFADIDFGYGAGSLLFHGLSVSVPIGEIIHVSGPTGQGQATFLKIAAGLANPTRGSILINGVDVTEMSFEEFVPFRLQIGYSFDQGGLLSNRSLFENLTLPIFYHDLLSEEEMRERVQAMAKRFHFENLLDKRPAMVPGGLRKLTTILRCLLVKPSLLIADDPFSGLDVETARSLCLLLGEMRTAGDLRTILLTSRDEHWALKLGERSSLRQLWIENGRASFEGRAA